MSLVLWGDLHGVQSTIAAIGASDLSAIVVAANRPQDHAAIGRLAADFGIPMLVHPPKAEVDARAAFTTRLASLSPVLFLVNSYSMILPESWIAIPRHGALNVHGALLPQFRGANVLNWAIINGESETGVTVHQIDAGIDTGPIVAQRRISITDDDTALSVRSKLSVLGEELLSEIIPQALRAPVAVTPQDNSIARVWSKRTPQDGKIDWSWPTDQIYNLIRALVSPWPGAFYLDASGNRVVIDTIVPRARIEQLRREVLMSSPSTEQRS